MKMKLHPKTTAMLLLLFGLTACDFSGINDAVDDFNLVIGLEPIHTSGSVLVTDAKTGELINDKITVTMTGPNGEDVIDMYSDPLPFEEINGGILNFGIRNALAPSPDDPARIRLVFSGDGYMTRSQTVEIPEEGPHQFAISLIKENDPPSGYRSASNTDGRTGADGSIEQDFHAEITNEQQTDVSFFVPAGTIFRDGQGNNLSGRITTKMTYYDPSERDVMASLPYELITADGDPVYTAGLLNLQIEDEHGNRAKQVSSRDNPSKSMALADAHNLVEFQMRIPDGYINPETGGPLQEGDELLIYTLDPDNIQKSSGSGMENLRYRVSGRATYHSEFRVTGYIPPVPTPEEEEGVPPPVDVPAIGESNPCIDLSNKIGDAEIKLDRSAGFNGPVNVVISGTGVQTQEFTIPGGKEAHRIDQTPGVQVNYEFDPGYGTISGTHDFCDGGLQVTLPTPPSTLVDATIEVALECPSPDEKVRITDIPASTLNYRKSNAAPGTRWATVENLKWNFDEEEDALSGGSFVASGVEQGVDYTFMISYDDNIHKADINIEGEQFTYPQSVDNDVCD